MPFTLQLKRYTTSEITSTTGADGELFIDTDKNVVVVNDGSTAGGFPAQAQLTSGTNIKTVNGTSLLGSGDIPLGISYTTGTTSTTGNLIVAGNLTVQGSVSTVNTEIVLNTEQANVIQVSYLQGNSSVNSGNITITGNLIPSANVTYDLGSPTNAFKSLFLSGNTIHLGGAKITTDPTTGAFAMVPRPTPENPNPYATVFDPYGTISQIATTAGLISAGAINTSVQAAAQNNAGTTFANLTVRTVANVGRLVTANGIFWANGTAYSSGSTYSNTTVASYLPVYSGNVASGNASVTTKLTAGSITTTNGVFWANGTAYSSGSSGTTLPSQSGNSGKYLTTDGSNLSWGTVAGGGGGGGTLTNPITLGPGLSFDNELIFSVSDPAAVNGSGNDRFGIGIAVDTNGTNAFVASAPRAWSNRGNVYIGDITSGNIMYNVINPSGSANEYFGGGSISNNDVNSAVAVFGSTLVVGVPNYSASSGRVYLYNMGSFPNWSSGSPTATVNSGFVSQTITSPSGNYSYFGYAVATNLYHVAVGAPGASGYAGNVYVYNKSGTLKYVVRDPTAYSTASNDRFGQAVAMTGNVMVVGAPYESDASNSSSGKAYIFNMNSFPTYSGTTQEITSSNYTSNGGVALSNPTSGYYANFGACVAVSTSYVAVGAPSATSTNTNNASVSYGGKVYVYNTSGTLLYSLDNPMPVMATGFFGCAIAMNDTWLVVGLPGDTTGSSSAYAGYALVYSLADGKLKKVLSNPNKYSTSILDAYGYAIGLYENTAVVGAWREQPSVSGTYNLGGVVYAHRLESSIDGSAAKTISLSKTAAVPGRYGYTDGSTNVTVPMISVDNYGRVVDITTATYSPSAGLSSAFTQVYVGGSPSFSASGQDYINFVAGTNVTLSADSGSKTITINSTGGGGDSGGGSAPFLAKVGPVMLSYSGGAATFTSPGVAGRLLIKAYSADAPIENIGGPGIGPFDQLMGPNTTLYGPSGTYYPWVSMSSVAANSSVSILMNTMSSPMSGSINMFAWVLDSSTQSYYSCYHANGNGYTSGGSGEFTIQNLPSSNGSLFWGTSDYFYGMVYLMGGGDLSAFSPAPGVTYYFDTEAQMGMIKIPGTIWSSGGVFGSLSGYNGSFAYQGFFFGG